MARSTLLKTFSLMSAVLYCSVTNAETPLADQPLFSTSTAPGNLALVLSVEFPTAISVAHTDRNYLPTNEYLGYFDPNKCYQYHYTNGASTDNYFLPIALANSHTCTGQWSGNFLNWASMQTIDPFRWVLTGGYRVIDTASLTVVEKAWGTQQGGLNNFPDSTLSGTLLAGATPFSTYPNVQMRIWGLGNKMRFVLGGNNFPLQGQYYNSTDLSGVVALTRTDYDFSSISGGVAPGPGVNVYNFSARWTGTVTAPATGNYSFQTVSDDGVRLYVNGILVIDNFTDHGPATDTATVTSIAANSSINIKVEYYQRGGGAVLGLKWLPPGASSYVPIGSSGSGDLSAAPTAYNGSNATSGQTFDLFVRAKACDAAVGLEKNCVKYGSNWKPEGLMQQYSKKIRYSAFGYLNDGNILRDGGVLRAQQKFVGPLKPVPGLPDISNSAAEWSATDGTFTLNPDATDAANTAAIMGLPSTNPVVNSGVINYLNKFGEITPGSYKTYDNVSELYYAAIRYFKYLPNVPQWTAVPSGTSNATRVAWTDGFPVITAPADPILYSCQRNFILGIGDVNTHADKDLPGNSITDNEPGVPAAVAADPTNEVDATNRVGVLEGLGSGLGLTNGYNGCCNNNSTLIAGAAYEAHVNDIRGHTPALGQTPQVIDTFWVDVLENQVYKNNNQFYLATKYGGFVVPGGYSYSNTTALPAASWHTNTDQFGDNPRPDNYFSGGRPDLMQAGLDAAFKKIANAIGAFTTSFASALPQVALTGNASFSGEYDASTWTGEVTASALDFDPSGSTTSLTSKWQFSVRLGTQLAGSGWNTQRRVITWNGTTGVPFRAPQLSGAQLSALDTSYVSGNDSSDYLNYLRGDRSHEIIPNAAPSTTLVYRARSKLVGDIVGSKTNPTGPPSFPFSDATNPGYANFKSSSASRRTVVYVSSNDGMMHAINGALDSATDANYGFEMFAYVPSAVFQGPTAPNTDGLATLGNADFTHHYLVNATPRVSDVDFARVPDVNKIRQNPSASTYNWRSVLIGGLGKGGKAYFAIDVTDPASIANGTEANAASHVLWEFSNASVGMTNQLGFSYGEPLVMKTAKYGWVVVFLSGYNNADGKGYFLFVNPQTGALLESVSTGAGGGGVDSGLATGNAFIVDATDGTADAIYAGDLLGNIWRLDVTGTSGSYPPPVAFAKLKSSDGTPQPVTTRPSIEVDPKTRRRYVLVGTGRLLDNTDISSTQGQSFYALLDGNNAAFSNSPQPAAATFPIMRNLLAPSININAAYAVNVNQTTQAGWYEDLGIDNSSPSSGIAWRVISDSTTSIGTVSFAAILTNGDVCSPSGSTRVYARNFANAQSTLRFPLTLYSPFGSYSGTATDLQYQSVNGQLRLVLGTDKGGAPLPVPIIESIFSVRRLNWRELQVVQ